LKKKPKIFFRADGNATIGLGHVIRSLAFAEMIKQYFECYFIIQNPSLSLQKQIQKVCANLIALDANDSMLEEAIFLTQHYFDKSSLVVLDGYVFDTAYQKAIKAIGCKLICIDDINAFHFASDVVINHAGGFSLLEYSTESNTKLYLGPSYALLRTEFQEAAQNKAPKPNTDSILICFGGADPKNDTLLVLQECIRHKPNASYHLVLGSAYHHWNVLEQYLKNTSANVRILRDLNAKEMVALMQKCPVAITSPSTISYEYLSTGGKLFLKVIADNQIRINNYLISHHLAFEFKDFPKVDQLSCHSSEQNLLFDGKQKKRYLKLLFELMLTIEMADQHDVELYFNWANDPTTRSQSFNNEQIKWSEHESWFENNVHSEANRFYKAMVADNPVGQIRYTLKENEALINYSVDINFRGLGIGSMLIEKTIPLLCKYYQKDFDVIGYVKEENIASVKVFRTLGFQEFKARAYDNTYKFILKCKT
jgi:UDP-2,4-diacetamido-2,4,6-trideoxy-beta-L-altropyranose hydrolase